MRALLATFLLAAAAGSGGAAAQDDPQATLLRAKAAAALATRRAGQLDRAAAREGDAATSARFAEAAMAARIRATQADIAAAEARVALVGLAMATQQSRLAQQQGPIARLLAALQSLAARPALVAIAQPGSVDDLVHVRAVLGSTIPAIRARTAGVRDELARTRALQRSAGLAAGALRDGRARLERNRLALVQLEAEHRLRARGLGRDALRESDRALALGEDARDLVGLMDQARDAADVEARLIALDGPLPRPGGEPPVPPPAAGYRLPVAGRIVIGFGELSDTGVRSRGLTLAVRPGAAVAAPAGGRVAFAGRFRQYGRVVIIDHGEGWTSALTGLGATSVARGDRIATGAVVGHAPAGDDPRVTVELRRRGRPVEAAALIG